MLLSRRLGCHGLSHCLYWDSAILSPAIPDQSVFQSEAALLNHRVRQNLPGDPLNLRFGRGAL